MKCKNCNNEITETILIHQDFYIIERIEDELKVEAENKPFCSRDCLNEWKWDKYYNYVEIDTNARSVSKQGQRKTA